jgi:xanthine/CO dehydrogenase XdhC/CoxF family maturation factor
MAGSDVTTVSDEHVLNEAAKWLDAGKNVALATVVSSWGSSPRPSGSQLAVSDDGTFVGSVSGGCIEGAVVTEALEVMKTKKPKVLDYGITNELAWDVGLACGGQVKIFVEALDK